MGPTFPLSHVANAMRVHYHEGLPQALPRRRFLQLFFFLLLCIKPPCLSFPPVLSKQLARGVANSEKARLCACAKVRVLSTREEGFRVTNLRCNDLTRRTRGSVK